jgi:hypothetical protein
VLPSSSDELPGATIYGLRAPGSATIQLRLRLTPTALADTRQTALAVWFVVCELQTTAPSARASHKGMWEPASAPTVIVPASILSGSATVPLVAFSRLWPDETGHAVSLGADFSINLPAASTSSMTATQPFIVFGLLGAHKGVDLAATSAAQAAQQLTITALNALPLPT